MVATLDSRADFINSWLTEAPSGTGNGSHDMFAPIEYTIRDYIKHGYAVTDIANGYRKIVGQSAVFYWHETNHTIDIAVELTIAPQSLTVVGLGKPSASPIRATDLYSTILKDNEYAAIRLMSDDLLSNQGLAVWKRLLSLGYVISVYDKNAPNQGLMSLHSEDEMMQYFQVHSNEYKRYQYVLTNTGKPLGEARMFFNTRRMRFLAGIL